jgi:hypothetical protein
VAGLDQHEVRVGQGCREFSSLLRRPGAIVAAVHHHGGLPDDAQLAGQVEVALAGELRSAFGDEVRGWPGE